MTISKTKANGKPSNKPHKLLYSTMILIGASTLFACSQADDNVSNTSNIQNERDIVTSNTAKTYAADNFVMATTTSNPELLKNVSATVYKDANCGCCKEWISHAEDHGMNATGEDVADLLMFKERYGVPYNMQSCHTTVTTDGYVFEGHVPAKYVAQFLENPPAKASGLAVPGMPMGSPGMEYQNQFDPYQIMQLNKDGTTEVYANIESVQQQL